jgi:hypothetical protein
MFNKNIFYIFIYIFLSLINGNQIITNTTTRIIVKQNPNRIIKSEDITIDYTNNYDNNDNLHDILVESMIRKKSFSSNKRLLMFAGLEGVGHHAMSTMFNVCINITNNITNINDNIVVNGKCLPVPELTTALMCANTTKRSGLFFANDASKAGLYLKTIYDDYLVVS